MREPIKPMGFEELNRVDPIITKEHIVSTMERWSRNARRGVETVTSEASKRVLRREASTWEAAIEMVKRIGERGAA